MTALDGYFAMEDFDWAIHVFMICKKKKGQTRFWGKYELVVS